MVDQTDHDGRHGAGPTARSENARSSVARLFAKTSAPDHTSAFRIDLLCEAFAAPEASRHQLAIEGLLQSDLPKEQILTDLIPETARRLGDKWMSDNLSFAEVTIGSARLQQMLHTQTRTLAYPVQNDAHRILMVVPLNKTHTLGAHVAAHMWRNNGVHVEMALGMTPPQIALKARENRFSAVCISVSARRNLAQARVVVESIKAVTRGTTKVFIGGGVTALDTDIKALTGCDFVCSDPEMVLELSGDVLVSTQP